MRMFGMIAPRTDLANRALPSMRGIANAFWQDAGFPPEIWHEIIQNHYSSFEKVAARFQEGYGKRVTRQARALVRAGVREGKIPVSENRMRNSFKRNAIQLADTLDDSMEDIGGYYDQRKATIGVSSSLLEAGRTQEEFVEMLVHEYIHSIEGQTHLQFIDKEEGLYLRDYEFVERTTLRGGLMFAQGDKQFPESLRFRWLNEAVTEIITDELIKGRKYPTYQTFRNATDYVLNAGSEKIPFDLVKRAYFEDYNPRMKNTIPA